MTAAAALCSCWAIDLLAGAQVLLEPVGDGDALGEGAGLVGQRLLEGEDFLLPVARGALGLGGEECAFSRASSAASLRTLSASRSACRTMRSASVRACTSAASAVPAAAGDPPGEAARG